MCTCRLRIRGSRQREATVVGRVELIDTPAASHVGEEELRRVRSVVEGRLEGAMVSWATSTIANTNANDTT